MSETLKSGFWKCVLAAPSSALFWKLWLSPKRIRVPKRPTLANSASAPSICFVYFVFCICKCLLYLFSKNASFDFESSFKCAVCCGTQLIHSAGKNVPKRFQINSCSTSTMNLSDTSIDSSVQSGILDNGESDTAANLQVNLSVTSSIQSDRIQDARSVQDLVAENNRLVQSLHCLTVG